ncbi:MAG TPA: hypothetical protein VGQ50_12000 [Actinomycetota bacterium]|nr:hypothetical protein [Actinomycetota bacterium]
MMRSSFLSSRGRGLAFMLPKTLTMPRFPEMALRDATELGTRRLEEDGSAEVRFDPARLLEGRLSRPTTAG